MKNTGMGKHSTSTFKYSVERLVSPNGPDIEGQWFGMSGITGDDSKLCFPRYGKEKDIAERTPNCRKGVQSEIR